MISCLRNREPLSQRGSNTFGKTRRRAICHLKNGLDRESEIFGIVENGSEDGSFSSQQLNHGKWRGPVRCGYPGNTA